MKGFGSHQTLEVATTNDDDDNTTATTAIDSAIAQARQELQRLRQRRHQQHQLRQDKLGQVVTCWKTVQHKYVERLNSSPHDQYMSVMLDLQPAMLKMTWSQTRQ